MTQETLSGRVICPQDFNYGELGNKQMEASLCSVATAVLIRSDAIADGSVCSIGPIPSGAVCGCM